MFAVRAPAQKLKVVTLSTRAAKTRSLPSGSRGLTETSSDASRRELQKGAPVTGEGYKSFLERMIKDMFGFWTPFCHFIPLSCPLSFGLRERERERERELKPRVLKEAPPATEPPQLQRGREIES